MRHITESVNETKLTRRIHVIRIYVAHGRPGVFEIQYKHSIARRNPMKEKTENGMSDMIDCVQRMSMLGSRFGMKAMFDRPSVYKRTKRDKTKELR